MTSIRADLTALRHAAYQRSNGRCEITGTILPGGPDGDWALHHRRRKGMGGTNRSDTHTLANVLALTHAAHNLRRPSAHLTPAWAYARGYLVRDADSPRLVPVWLFGQRWTLLDTDGYLWLPATSEPPPPGGSR